MIIAVIIILSALLLVSIGITYKFYNIANFQMNKADTYEEWIKEFRDDVKKTYIEIRELDNRQIFEKDDEVGIVFQDLLNIIDKLNNRVQEESE
jgi:hypothetical protein